MRRFLGALIPSAIGLALLACATLPTAALPQSPPVVLQWKQVLTSPTSKDSIPVYGTLQVGLTVDSIVTRYKVDTVPVPGPVVHDTLYCSPAGVCSPTKPAVVLTDSVVKDTVVKPVRGIPFSSSHYPAAMFGKGTYTGTVLTTAGCSPLPASCGFRSELERIKAAGAHVILGLSRSKSIANGLLSVKAVKDHIASWPDLTPYLAVIDGVMVSDDITGTQIWGPGAPYYPQIDSLGLLVKQRYKLLPTYVRARPSELIKYKGWKWIDGGWSQYSARKGDVNAYREADLAALDVLSKTTSVRCNIWGLNVIDGGDGSSKIPGGADGKWQMSAAEVVKYAKALVGFGPWFGWWEYRPAFDTLPANKPAIKAVRAMADSAVRKVCAAR